MDKLSGQVMLDGFTDSFVPDRLSDDEDLEAVRQVIDDILSGPESPDVPSHQIGQENPLYEEFGDRNTTAIMMKSPDREFDIGLPPESQLDYESASRLDDPASEKSAAFEETVGIGEGSSELLADKKIEAHVAKTPSEVNQKSPEISSPKNAVRGAEKSALLEPENMVQWRKDRAELIARHDALEAEKKKELCELGKSQFEIWEKNYNEVLEASRIKNRESNDAFLQVDSFEREKIGFLDSLSSVPKTQQEETLTAWEYVAKLCDLRPNNRNIKSDVSRMRLLLLQLKNEKFSGPKVMEKSK